MHGYRDIHIYLLIFFNPACVDVEQSCIFDIMYHFCICVVFPLRGLFSDAVSKSPEIGIGIPLGRYGLGEQWKLKRLLALKGIFIFCIFSHLRNLNETI